MSYVMNKDKIRGFKEYIGKYWPLQIYNAEFWAQRFLEFEASLERPETPQTDKEVYIIANLRTAVAAAIKAERKRCVVFIQKHRDELVSDEFNPCYVIWGGNLEARIAEFK